MFPTHNNDITRSVYGTFVVKQNCAARACNTMLRNDDETSREQQAQSPEVSERVTLDVPMCACRYLFAIFHPEKKRTARGVLREFFLETRDVVLYTRFGLII